MIVFKLPIWFMFMIILPATFTLYVMLGIFDVQTEYAIRTPGGLVALAFISALVCFYGIIQLIITYTAMADIQSKLARQLFLIKTHDDRLTSFRSEWGHNLGNKATQIQFEQIHKAKMLVESEMSKTTAEREAWLTGPIKKQASYFFKQLQIKE